MYQVLSFQVVSQKKSWRKTKSHAFKMENIILKNMKIMENISNTLEEINNYVNEIMEELI